MSNSIMQAFKKLNVTSSSEDHENIFEVSYQYLTNVKNFDDSKSFNNCLVALINLDKYQKALELIKHIKNEDIINQYAIEVGYVYYKTKQSKLLQTLYERIVTESASKFLVRGLKHVMAQEYYQRGENSKALELYHDLIKGNEEIDSSLDLYTNELAIISQLNILENKYVEPISSDIQELSHDLQFNMALISLSKNELTESLKYLENAFELLKVLDLDDESLQIEKSPLLITQAYIYQLQGKETGVTEILDELKLAEFNDLLINIIINNNYYSIGDLITEDIASLNLVQRSLNIQQCLNKLSSKLNFNQYNSLVKNNLLLKFLTGSLASNSNYLKNVNLENFLSKGDFTLLSFKVLTKLGITNEDLVNDNKIVAKKLFKIINSSIPSSSNFNELVVIGLLLFSLNNVTGNYNQSLASLEKLAEFNLKDGPLLPGLLGSLINLYEILDANKSFNSLIDQLVNKLENSTQLSHDVYDFYKVVGFKLLIIGDEKYTTIFQSLNSINSKDSLISNVLNKTNNNLLETELLVSNIDESIINTDIETLIPHVQKKSTIKVNKIEKKRVRKAKFSSTKVLKPIDQVTIDKERWLPMTLRSYYKPKKSKKKISSHQGAVESPQASQTNTPSSTPAPSTPSTSTSSASTAKKNQKKKKKKGKK